MGSRMPYGTVQCSCQDVASGILISIQHKPAVGTSMCPGRERFLYPLPTARTILAGVVWGNCYYFYPMHHSVGLDPAEELSLGCIMDALRQCMVLHQVAYLQVFIGNKIVR